MAVETFPIYETEYAAMRSRIIAARKHAISYKQFEGEKETSAQEGRELYAEALQFDREAYNAGYNALREDPARVFVNNPHEYHMLLHMLQLPKEIEAHEWAHWLTAVDRGFIDPMVGVLFVQHPFKKTTFPVAFTLFGKVPETMSSEDALAGMKATLLAPPHPSVSDLSLFV